VVGHGGGCPGYLTQFMLVPEKKWVLMVMVNGLGVNVEQYLKGMYHILRAYEQEEDDEDSAQGALKAYGGRYYSFWDGESVIVPWKGKLASFSLRSASQGKPDMLMKQIEGDSFKRIEDGALKEAIKFERNERGDVVRFWQHSQYINKIE
jgi:hypothetical protein